MGRSLGRLAFGYFGGLVSGVILPIVEVYHPPRNGLLHLAVAIMPDGKVHGVTADTADATPKMGDDILAELAKTVTRKVRDAVPNEALQSPSSRRPYIVAVRNFRMPAYL